MWLEQIPQPLRDQLVYLKPVLEKNGTVVCRKEPNRRPSYRVRYRTIRINGKQKHHALLIPDNNLAPVVSKLLEEWQAPAKDRRKQLAIIRRAQRAIRLNERKLRKAVCWERGKTTQERARIGKEFDQAYRQGEGDLLLYLLHPGRPRPPHRGRPRISSLL